MKSTATGHDPTWRQCRIWPAASSLPTRTSASVRPSSRPTKPWPASTPFGTPTTPMVCSTHGWVASDVARDGYLGYRHDDYNTPFALFYQPEMAPLPRHVVCALEHGPQAGP